VLKWKPLLAAVLALAPIAFAQPSHPKPEDRNAALKYWSAWSMTEREASTAVGEIDWNNPSFPPDLVKKVESLDGVMQMLTEASRLRKCDFEIEYDKGVDALLPHLGKARQSARILRAGARVKLDAGDADAAAERLATIYRIAEHVSHDDVLISSLVSVAITTFANEDAKTLAASGRLSAAGRDELLSAMSRLSGNDPFHARAAIKGERDLTTPWIKQVTGPDAGARLVTMTGAIGESADALRKLNGEQVAKATEGLGRYYDDVVAAWDDDDAVAKLTALGDDLSAKYGPVAAVLSAAFGKARASDLKAQAELAETLAAVKAAKVK
jgi:hypothetical protein